MSSAPRLVAPDARVVHYVVAPDRAAHTEAVRDAMRVDVFANALWSVVVVALVARAKLAPRVARWAARRTPRAWLQVICVAAVVLAAVAVAQLPVELIVRPRLHELAGLSRWSWLAAWPTETVWSVGVGTLAASIGYALARRYGRGWWWRAWLLVSPLIVVMPMFGAYLEQRDAAPLAPVAPALVDQIVELAHGRGIALERDHVFISPSSSPDAHADGIGEWRAVFVNEGALANLDDRELSFLVAHEVGHFYGAGVVAAAIGLAVLAAGGALWLFAFLVALLVRRFGARYDVPAVEHPASLSFVLVVVTVFAVAFNPLRAVGQRQIEHAADANGMQLLAGRIADPGQAAAHELQRVGEVFALPADDSVLDVLAGVDHPAIAARIDFVLAAAQR